MESTIKNTGLGSNVAQVELHFAVVCFAGYGRESYCVYVFHGAPANEAWWRGRAPIASLSSLQIARDLVDVLAGIKDAWKSFPTWVQQSRGWVQYQPEQE